MERDRGEVVVRLTREEAGELDSAVQFSCDHHPVLRQARRERLRNAQDKLRASLKGDTNA